MSAGVSTDGVAGRRYGVGKRWDAGEGWDAGKRAAVTGRELFSVKTRVKVENKRDTFIWIE